MKAIWQLIGAILVAVMPLATGDHHLATSEWINILLVALGVATVYIAGNLPTGPWQLTKTMMSGLQAGAVGLVSALTDTSVSSTEGFQCGIAALSVWAVYQVSPRGSVTTVGRHRAGAPAEDQVNGSGPALPGEVDSGSNSNGSGDGGG